MANYEFKMITFSENLRTIQNEGKVFEKNNVKNVRNHKNLVFVIFFEFLEIGK